MCATASRNRRNFRRLLEHKADVARAPVREVLQHHWLPPICAIGLTIIGDLAHPAFEHDLPTHVVEQLHLPLWRDCSASP